MKDGGAKSRNLLCSFFLYTFVSFLGLYMRQANNATTDKFHKPVIRPPPCCLRSTQFPVISKTKQATKTTRIRRPSMFVLTETMTPTLEVCSVQSRVCLIYSAKAHIYVCVYMYICLYMYMYLYLIYNAKAHACMCMKTNYIFRNTVSNYSTPALERK